ncbi:hypothetical protein V8E53_011964 [Lactarius tabidus]
MVLLRVAEELFLRSFLVPFVCFLLIRKNRPPILYFFGAFNFTLASFCLLFRLQTPAHSLSSALPFLLLFFFILVHPVFFCVCLFLIVVCLLLTAHVSHRPTVTSLSLPLSSPSLSLMDIACIPPNTRMTQTSHQSFFSLSRLGPPIVVLSRSCKLAQKK